MKGKILFATGLAVGYVLGTRAGRERYEEIKAFASNFWNSPRVQKQVHTAEDLVSDGAKKAVSSVANRVSAKASSSTSKARTTAASKPRTTRSSTARSSTAE
jgi:hypothetical protein